MITLRESNQMEQFGRNAFLSSAILIQISGAKAFVLSRRRIIYSIIACKCKSLWQTRKTLQQSNSMMMAARAQQKHDVTSSPSSKPVNALPLVCVVERTKKPNPIFSGIRKKLCEYLHREFHHLYSAIVRPIMK